MNFSIIYVTISLSNNKEVTPMKFAKEDKMAFVKRYQEGESVIRICNENQIPRSTFYRWIQNYQQTVTDTGTVVTPQAFQHLKRKVKKIRRYGSGFENG